MCGPTSHAIIRLCVPASFPCLAYSLAVSCTPRSRTTRSGAYDVASRAAITGAVAGATCLLVLTLSKRWLLH